MHSNNANNHSSRLPAVKVAKSIQIRLWISLVSLELAGRVGNWKSTGLGVGFADFDSQEACGVIVSLPKTSLMLCIWLIDDRKHLIFDLTPENHENLENLGPCTKKTNI